MLFEYIYNLAEEQTNNTELEDNNQTAALTAAAVMGGGDCKYLSGVITEKLQ
jgi:hypothetical protein